MLYYGIFGIVLSFICIIILTYVPCGDDTLPEFSKIICKYKDENDNYYFDSYTIYFKEFMKEYFGWKIFLLIIYSILFYSYTYYCYAIYKILSPIYQICTYRINFLITAILGFVNGLVKDEKEGVGVTLSVFDILIMIFYLIGSMVYLEFIELKFCKLDFYIKKNIKQRALSDTRISLGSVNSDIEELE